MSFLLIRYKTKCNS